MEDPTQGYQQPQHLDVSASALYLLVALQLGEQRVGGEERHTWEESFVSLSSYRHTPHFEGVAINCEQGSMLQSEANWMRRLMPNLVKHGEVTTNTNITCRYHTSKYIHQTI